MRVNRYVAAAVGIGRRKADVLIAAGKVTINGNKATLGDEVNLGDIVKVNNQVVGLQVKQTIMLNKPVGYICSRDGQGNKTIYDILPSDYHNLNPVGRLDKDSSGLLLLTNDGDFAQSLSHPSAQKDKIYTVELDKTLDSQDREQIEKGVVMGDGISKLELGGQDKNWTVTMHEGRNRQIRRTFETLGYIVQKLHRTSFGEYQLGDLESGKYKVM